MFERMWDEDPVIQRIKAEARGEAKGKAEGEAIGKAEGEAEAAKDMVMIIVQARFPQLTPLAQKMVLDTTTIETLRQLAKLITLAPDEATARWTLSTLAA